MQNNMANTPMYQSTGNVLSSSTDFGRKYRVLVYRHNVDGINYPQANSEEESKFVQQQEGDTILDVSDLRCTFDIKQCAMYYPNTATVTIYNLTAEAENSIIYEGYRIVVEAGYANSDNDQNYGTIFDGDVIMCSRTKQNGTDYILKILAMDGGSFYMYGFANFTVAKGQTARQVVENITNKAAVSISLGYASTSLDTVKFSKSQSVHGLSKDTLNDICKTINGTWFILNGKLYIFKYSESTDYLPMGKQAVELSEKTGLLGNPEQVDYGIHAKMLLNPQVVPFGLVHIKNDKVTRQLVTVGQYSEGISKPYKLDPYGVYRVADVHHHGDTRSNDWYTEISAIDQNGSIPEFLSTSGESTAN